MLRVADCHLAAFEDLSPDAWYHPYVDYAVEMKLMNGTSGTTFAPGGAATRGAIVSILYRLAGSPETGTAAFADVKEGAWYAAATAWAAENGIVSGYSDSRFGPEDPITREQLALILYRYAEHLGHGYEARADLSGFSDSPSVHAWAYQAVSWANSEGLLNGRTATTLAPGETALRAEIAAILMRFCQGIAGLE